ncbi:MAG: O-antigen ligase family protein [Actinobacteria bacterium]|nr:O-antigen ligase family protein [Actinomycetota bacterium]
MTGLIKYGNAYVFRHSAILYYSIFSFLVPAIFINIKQFKIFNIVSIFIIFFNSIISITVNNSIFGGFINYYQGVFLFIIINSLILIKNKLINAIQILIAAILFYEIIDMMVRSAWVAFLVAILFNLVLLIIFRKKLAIKKSFYLKISLIVILTILLIVSLGSFNLKAVDNATAAPETTTAINNEGITVDNTTAAPETTTAINNEGIIVDNTTAAPETTTAQVETALKTKITGYIDEFKSIYEHSDKTSVSAVNAKWRLIVWKDIIKKSMQRPILGYGFGMLYNNETFKVTRQGYVGDVGFIDPHNSYLSILYRTGIVGLLIFLLFIISFFVKMIKFLRGCQDLSISIYMISILSAVIYILGYSFFLVVLEGPHMGIFLWVFIGLALSLSNIYDMKIKSMF